MDRCKEKIWLDIDHEWAHFECELEEGHEGPHKLTTCEAPYKKGSPVYAVCWEATNEVEG